MWLPIMVAILIFFQVAFQRITVNYFTENHTEPYRTQNNYSFFLINVPIIIFCFGASSAKQCYMNVKYNYIIPQIKQQPIVSSNNSAGDTLKLLSIGDNISVFTDLKNEEIFLIPIEDLPPIKSK